MLGTLEVLACSVAEGWYRGSQAGWALKSAKAGGLARFAAAA